MNYDKPAKNVEKDTITVFERVADGRRDCNFHQATVKSASVVGSIDIEVRTSETADFEKVGNSIDFSTPGRSVAFFALVYSVRAVPTGLTDPYDVEFLGAENS